MSVLRSTTGMVEKVDGYFTHIRLEGGELRLFSHRGTNAVDGLLRKEGAAVLVELLEVDMVEHARALPYDGVANAGQLAAEAAHAEQAAFVPVRKRA